MNAEQVKADLTRQIEQATKAGVQATIAAVRQGKHDRAVRDALKFCADIEFVEPVEHLRELALDACEQEDARFLYDLAELLDRARPMRLRAMADPGCMNCRGYGTTREAIDAPERDCDCVTGEIGAVA